MNRSALSRADLIRWAASLDEARLGRLAETLGYQDKPADQVVGVSSLLGAVRVVAKVGEAPPATAALRHRQYRVVERHVLAPLPDQPEPPPTPAPEPQVVPLGPPPPLIPWSRLWPFLRAALGELAERNRIDLPRLVSACSRVRPLRRLPRLKGQRWAPKGQLILDLSRRLYPFWNDFNTLKAALPRLRGENGLEILRMDQGPAGPVQPWESGVWGPPRPYVPPAAGIPVLIVGDVGCLGTSAERQAWVRLGRRLAGTGRVPVVLTPCPPRWWDRVLSGLYFPVALDRNSHLPPRPTGPRPWPARPVDLAQAVQEDPGARLLLTLLSACVAIRPALLRHLRHRLPADLADLADAGSEAAAWQHPAFIAGDFELLPGDPVPLGYLRLAFHQTGSDAERQLAWDLIRAQQALGATRSRCMEERSLHAVMNGRSDPAAESFLDELAGAMDQADQRNDPEHARSLAALVNRRAEHMHPEGWRQSPRLEALWLKANPRAEEDGAVLPLGYEIRRALAVAGRPERPQDWRLVQRGDGLEFEPLSVTEGPLTGARPLLERSSTRRPIVQVQENRSGAPESSLPLGDGLALPLTESGWRLRTDFEELVIAPLERPAWAHTLGRDGDGLFVGFRDGQGERRAYWCAPLEWLEWPGSPTRPEASPWDGHGGFIDEDQYQALRSLGLASEGDGLSLHSDGFGLRAEIEIKGVPIGLRWIWPGAFLMGSPATEQGRYDRETWHQVILTRGFWLAETACTQALWLAVMGEKPSYHKGPQRPVEQVSWEDVRRFIERLNSEQARSAQRTLRFRLPTEAEWEYACRAGTATAYSFGDVFDPKLANNGSETVDVRSLPPNPWGLYEMHGNVYEWCWDWFGDYPVDPVVDPQGPDSGERRVLRGGGWIIGARRLRSACRYHDDPGGRYRYIGFRLALGPEPSREAGDDRPAGSGAGLPAPGASGSERKARAVRSRGGRGGHGK